MKRHRDGLMKHLIQVFIAGFLLLAVKELLLYYHATSFVSQLVMVVMWGVIVIASLLFLRKWLLVFRKQRDQDAPPSYETSLPTLENRH